MVEVFETGGVHQTVEVARRGLRVGRGPDQDLILSSNTISKAHARLFWRGDDLFAQDLDSRNGTRRDGLPLTGAVMLQDGDELVLGGTVVLRVKRFGSSVGVAASDLEALSSDLDEATVLTPIPDVGVSDAKLLATVTRIYQAASVEELALQLTRSAGELLEASRIALLEIEGDRYRAVGLYKLNRSDPTPLTDASFVSRSVVERAKRDGIALFVHADREMTGRSLMAAGAISAAAARIRSQDGRLRVLYADRRIGQPLMTAAHSKALGVLSAHAGGAFDTLGARMTKARDLMRFEQLRRYFSPAVVEHILAGRDDLLERPQYRHATVLFADLVAYTKMSERLRDEPERMLALLNRWLDIGAEAVIAQNGTLDKFIGDCVMAVFGVPVPGEQAEVRAVHCALAMRDAISHVVAADGAPIEITVGINTGPVLAGSVGSRRRLEYTVLGDVVNVAARLQGQARPGEILVGPETAAAVQNVFRLEDAGVRELKNHGPVRAARVVGSSHSSSPGHRSHPP